MHFHVSNKKKRLVKQTPLTSERFNTYHLESSILYFHLSVLFGAEHQACNRWRVASVSSRKQDPYLSINISVLTLFFYQGPLAKYLRPDTREKKQASLGMLHFDWLIPDLCLTFRHVRVLKCLQQDLV